MEERIEGASVIELSMNEVEGGRQISGNGREKRGSLRVGAVNDQHL